MAVLDETVGHDNFLKAVRAFLGRYRESGAKLLREYSDPARIADRNR